MYLYETKDTQCCIYTQHLMHILMCQCFYEYYDSSVVGKIKQTNKTLAHLGARKYQEK